METMTVTNEKTLQQGLNDVVINKVQRMIDGKSVGVNTELIFLNIPLLPHTRRLLSSHLNLVQIPPKKPLR